MIRFQPDTLAQAFTRFFDMAAPDANVYVEIPAPDLRMGSLVLLAVAAALLWRRLAPHRAATGAMLALLVASSVVWLATTGNGRYFLPLLVCAGPITIGLLCLLPLTREWKALLGVSLLAAQVFVMTQQPPWRQWSWLDWTTSPYFPVQLGVEETGAPPTTYATLSTISYSLIAPQFPANARWINIAATGATPRDSAWMDTFLRRAAGEGPMRLLAPSLPTVTLDNGRPTADVLVAFDKLIASHNLRITGDCRLIPSIGSARLEHREEAIRLGKAAPMGFWSCPLAYEQRHVPDTSKLVPEPMQQSLVRLAELCPRFFPLSEGGITRLLDGWEKNYVASETRVYVLDNGDVWYKFWRSLNPVLIGKAADLVANKVSVDCDRIRGEDRAWRTGAQ